MINLFGSIKRVTGFGGNLFPERTYENPNHPKYGETFEVNTSTTLMAALEFENGVLGTFHISSDSTMTQNFVVTGTQGALKLGDPNMFNAELKVTRPGAQPPVGFLARPAAERDAEWCCRRRRRCAEVGGTGDSRTR